MLNWNLGMAKKIHVCILEFDYHAEVLRELCFILKDSGLKISIFTTEKIWSQTQINLDKWDGFNIFLKNKTLKSFLNLHSPILNKSDIIFFNTMASNFYTFSKYRFVQPVILRVHNGNSLFFTLKKSFSPKYHLFFLWKDFSHFIRKEFIRPDWFYKNKTLNKIDFYAFPFIEIRNYAITTYPQIRPNNSFVLPISSSSTIASAKKKQNQYTTITIIGRIDYRSRDYEIVYESFKKLKKEKESIPTKLVFLGRTFNKNASALLLKFKKLEDDDLKIICFNEFVPQHEFEMYLSQTDFLIVPVKKETRYRIFKEIYGKTKISGNINDIIRYKIPALVNATYPLDPELSKVIESFENANELAEKIKLWATNRTWQNLDFKSLEKEYNKENLQRIYIEAFQNIQKSLSKESYSSKI